MYGAQLLQHQDVGGGDPLGVHHLPHAPGPHTHQVKFTPIQNGALSLVQICQDTLLSLVEPYYALTAAKFFAMKTQFHFP